MKTFFVVLSLLMVVIFPASIYHVTSTKQTEKYDAIEKCKVEGGHSIVDHSRSMVNSVTCIKKDAIIELEEQEEQEEQEIDKIRDFRYIVL